MSVTWKLRKLWVWPKISLRRWLTTVNPLKNWPLSPFLKNAKCNQYVWTNWDLHILNQRITLIKTMWKSKLCDKRVTFWPLNNLSAIFWGAGEVKKKLFSTGKTVSWCHLAVSDKINDPWENEPKNVANSTRIRAMVLKGR